MNNNPNNNIPISNEDVLRLISSLEGSITKCLQAGDNVSAAKFQQMLDMVKIPVSTK